MSESGVNDKMAGRNSTRPSIGKKMDVDPIIARIDMLEEKLSNKFSENIKTMESKWDAIVSKLVDNQNSLTENVTDLGIQVSQVKETVTEVKSKLNQIDEEFSCVNAEILRLDYLCHLNQLNIKNIPEKPNENLFEVFKSIAEKLDIPVTKDLKSCISSIFRIGKKISNINESNAADSSRSSIVNKSNSRIVIVKFHSTEYRNLVFSKYLENIKLTTHQIGLSSTQNDKRIYINEYLHPCLRQVFNLACKLKAEKKLLKLNVKNGNIIITKHDGQTMKVYSIDVLQQIIN